MLLMMMMMMMIVMMMMMMVMMMMMIDDDDDDDDDEDEGKMTMLMCARSQLYKECPLCSAPARKLTISTSHPSQGKNSL